MDGFLEEVRPGRAAIQETPSGVRHRHGQRQPGDPSAAAQVQISPRRPVKAASELQGAPDMDFHRSWSQEPADLGILEHLSQGEILARGEGW